MSEKKLTFGQWLLNRRTELGLSQQELAGRTRGVISKAYVSWLENDRKSAKSGALPKPTQEKFEALAAALRVPLIEILKAAGWKIEATGTPNNDASGKVDATTAMLYEISEEFETLPREVRDDLRHDFELMGKALLEMVRSRAQRKGKR